MYCVQAENFCTAEPALGHKPPSAGIHSMSVLTVGVYTHLRKSRELILYILHVREGSQSNEWCIHLANPSSLRGSSIPAEAAGAKLNPQPCGEAKPAVGCALMRMRTLSSSLWQGFPNSVLALIVVDPG